MSGTAFQSAGAAWPLGRKLLGRIGLFEYGGAVRRRLCNMMA